MRRCCPACVRRYAALVAPDCPVCKGVGVLGLGAAALHHYEPAVVARAVEFYLEAKAREAAEQLPLGAPRREALAAATDELRYAGVIADPLVSGDPARHRADAPEGTARRVTDAEAARLAYLTGATPSPVDQANLDRPPILYGPDDRPLARSLPVVSAAGSPTFLARAADPADPLGDTRAAVYERRARDWRANVVAAAVDRVRSIRTRRQARRAARERATLHAGTHAGTPARTQETA
ncbi:hypothetical protein [Carbonactinospora thermoautotrophica]|nr:hypothetical protein [Carbonactinospora thermoautotrophica]